MLSVQCQQSVRATARVEGTQVGSGGQCGEEVTAQLWVASSVLVAPEYS